MSNLGRWTDRWRLVHHGAVLGLKLSTVAVVIQDERQEEERHRPHAKRAEDDAAADLQAVPRLAVAARDACGPGGLHDDGVRLRLRPRVSDSITRLRRDYGRHHWLLDDDALHGREQRRRGCGGRCGGRVCTAAARLVLLATRREAGEEIGDHRLRHGHLLLGLRLRVWQGVALRHAAGVASRSETTKSLATALLCVEAVRSPLGGGRTSLRLQTLHSIYARHLWSARCNARAHQIAILATSQMKGQ